MHNIVHLFEGCRWFCQSVKSVHSYRYPQASSDLKDFKSNYFYARDIWSVIVRFIFRSKASWIQNSGLAKGKTVVGWQHSGKTPAVVISSLAWPFSPVRSSDNHNYFTALLIVICTYAHTLLYYIKGKPKKNLIFDANLQTDFLAFHPFLRLQQLRILSHYDLLTPSGL